MIDLFSLNLFVSLPFFPPFFISDQIEEYQYHGLVRVAKDLTEKAKKKKLLQEEEERQGLEPGSLSPPEQSTAEEGSDRQNTMMLVEWDLPRTFPTLRFFHDGKIYMTFISIF